MQNPMVEILRNMQRNAWRLCNLAYKTGHQLQEFHPFTLGTPADRANDIGDWYLQLYNISRRMKRLLINRPFTPIVDCSVPLCLCGESGGSK